MKVSIIKVSRYAYEDKQGAYHEGTVLSVLMPTAETKDNVGYDVKEFRLNYNLFDEMTKLFKENKPVELVMDYVPMRNGNYYAKAKSINGIEL